MDEAEFLVLVLVRGVTRTDTSLSASGTVGGAASFYRRFYLVAVAFCTAVPHSMTGAFSIVLTLLLPLYHRIFKPCVRTYLVCHRSDVMIRPRHIVNHRDSMAIDDQSVLLKPVGDITKGKHRGGERRIDITTTFPEGRRVWKAPAS